MSTPLLEPERVFTRHQAAIQLGISLSTLKRLIKESRIGFYRTGKRKTVIGERHISGYLSSVEEPAIQTESEVER